MKTFMGNDIREDTLAVLYLCHYDHSDSTISVADELQFSDPFEALQAYSNIRNPESQMASGWTMESFELELRMLHDKLRDEEWVRELADYL